LNEKIKNSPVFSHPIGYLLIWIVAFGLFALIGRMLAGHVDAIASDSTHILVLHVSAIIAVLTAILIIIGGYRISHLGNYSSRSLKLALIPSLLIFILTIIAVRSMPTSLALVMSNGIFLIITSFLLGELLSREVIKAGHLLPVAIVLALVDFWSVSQGPSKQIAQKAAEFTESGGYAQEVVPPFISFLLLNFPQLATDKIYSFIGVGDLIILAFFIGCIYRFNLPKMQSYAALIAGPTISVMTANIIGKGIPALPVIAVLFILVNLRHLSLSRKEIVISIIAVVFIIILVWVLRLL
jgi:hypothetical protein